MDRWYGVDELRHSWFLLRVDTVQNDSRKFIGVCEIGDGNADQLINSDTFTAEDLEGESQLLETIGAKLDERRYNDITLITPTNESLAILRTRFLDCDQIRQPTLRGFRHISIAELLDSYFSANRTDELLSLISRIVDTSDYLSEEQSQREISRLSVEELWETRTAIGPLVPMGALQGTLL